MFNLSITNIVFLGVAGFTGYKAATEKDKNLRLVYGLAAGIAGFKFITDKLYELPSDDVLYQDVLPPSPADTQIVESVVNQLYSVLSSWLIDGADRCDAYERLFNLPDAEFIEVANTYKNRYRQTLRNAIFGTFQSGCSIFYTDYEEKVINRLNSLNIP